MSAADTFREAVPPLTREADTRHLRASKRPARPLPEKVANVDPSEINKAILKHLTFTTTTSGSDTTMDAGMRDFISIIPGITDTSKEDWGPIVCGAWAAVV